MEAAERNGSQSTEQYFQNANEEKQFLELSHQNCLHSKLQSPFEKNKQTKRTKTDMGEKSQFFMEVILLTGGQKAGKRTLTLARRTRKAMRVIKCRVKGFTLVHKAGKCKVGQKLRWVKTHVPFDILSQICLIVTYFIYRLNW